MNLIQFVLILHNICRGRGSNPKHPTYSLKKKNKNKNELNN